jgi:dihydrofolate synthase/folylpolyglutamate synthase
VLEVGMGGRWDATRLARSRVAGLTNIGTDHAAWLGEERRAIANDKGAVLAAAELAVLGPEVDPPMVDHLGVDGAFQAEELVELEEGTEGRVHASWNGIGVELTPPLIGRHQRHNLHLAMALARAAERAGLVPRLDPVAVGRGLGRVRWPGRLSRHLVCGREILIDGAHNLEATRALAAHLARQPRRFNLLFSCLDDKPLDKMAAILRPAVNRVAVCPLADERAMPAVELHRSFPDAEVSDTPLGALERLPDPVLAAGSLRLAGALLDHEEGA